MSAPTSGTSTADPTAAYRLPTTVRPEAYRLVLEPDLEAATFSGDVEIDLVVEEPTTTIVLNAAELEITSAELNDRNPDAGYALAPTSTVLDAEEERVTLVFAEPLAVGAATLHLGFTGLLNDKLRGFYRSTFTDAAGTEHTIATTQMESTDARRAFPCFDEPAFKATFEVTLVVDGDLAAYSNGSVVEEAPDPIRPGKRRVRFAPTMVMSTYLVAFVVGPLEHTDPVDVGGVPLRVVHPRGKGDLTSFALEVGAHALGYFADYFGIPYPADKLDLVAIPDFAFGAMENLGCVTFRESALLVDPDRASRAELERVCDVICHEIAHMWFGDLVTMRWWNGIWLNEAFATFMEVLATDAFRPEWERWVSFGMEREAAMAVDALHATRPVEFPVGRPEEADGMFDVLTYQKGGSVLRMLEQFIGPEVFRLGINDYLTTHAHSNTETTDLWDALERSSGRDVRSIMGTFIDQGGLPLVTVDKDGTLAQQPFALTGEPGGAIGERWQVPVLLRRMGDDARVGASPALLDGSEMAIGPDLAPGRGDLVVNAGGSGYYRVRYPSAALARLSGSLSRLAPLERFNLVSDTWAVALSGAAPLADFLAVARALADTGEREPSAWAAVLGVLALLDRIASEADRPVVAAATGSLLVGLAGELGWDPRDDDDERTPSLRAGVLRTLGRVGGDGQVAMEARRRFDAMATTPLHPDTASAVLDIVGLTGTPADFELCLERYRGAANPQEENRYLNALADFDDPGLAARTFELAVTEVRTQDAPYLIRTMLTNRANGADTWTRVTGAWDTLVERFPANSLPRMLDGIRILTTVADDVRTFVEAHPLPSGGRTVEQILERLDANVAFARREGPDLAATLRNALDLPAA